MPPESQSGSSSSGGSGSLWTAAGIISLIASWLVTNLVIQPVGYTLAVGQFYANKALSTFWNGLTTAFGNAGGTVASELDSVRDQLFRNLGDLVANAGLAAPFTAATLLSLLLVATIAIVVVVIPWLVQLITGRKLLP